jgi:hypothetical protein
MALRGLPLRVTRSFELQGTSSRMRAASLGGRWASVACAAISTTSHANSVTGGPWTSSHDRRGALTSRPEILVADEAGIPRQGEHNRHLRGAGNGGPTARRSSEASTTDAHERAKEFFSGSGDGAIARGDQERSPRHPRLRATADDLPSWPPRLRQMRRDQLDIKPGLGSLASSPSVEQPVAVAAQLPRARLGADHLDRHWS